MKGFTIVAVLLLSLIAGNVNAGLRGRESYGPVILGIDAAHPAGTGNFPSDNGFSVANFDGDMTVTSYWKGSTSITWVVQVSNFTQAEDPTGASFVTITGSAHSATQIADTIQGPIERMRFNVSAFTAGTTWVKVTGRVAP